MGVQIRTIIKDNVAIRCDGCLQVIDGTPWRINLLDIVSAETAVAWTDRAPINPGPFEFHPDPACVRRWMAAKGYLFCRRGEVREIMRPIAIPVDPSEVGSLRRDPPRRPRVRARLIDGLLKSRLTERSRGPYPPAALSKFPFPRFAQICVV